MDKKLKIYISVFIAMVAIIMYMEAVKPAPLNWFPSYVSTHKIPYGTYVLKEELKTIFPDTELKTIRRPPYLLLKDSTEVGTYFFVDGALGFGKEEFNEIMKFVDRGNDVFMSTNGAFIDTLGLETRSLTTTAFKEQTYYKHLNKQLDTSEYVFDRAVSKMYFTEVDTLKTTALGSLIIKNSDEEVVGEGINFIKYKHGKGNFYIHVFPEAFTNYNILKDNNHQYVAGVLSYINPEKPIFWDAYYKTGKTKIASPMYFILSSENLKWAYYIALIGVLFFVLFKGKRNQRLIPIVTPLKNQTVAFTRTIANMYYEKSEHKNIATHKINYFLEYLRIQFKVSTTDFNEEFYAHTALRSGNTLEDVKELFNKIKEIQTAAVVSKEQLITLNTLIEDFKKSTNS